ncbi:sal-like protein 3 [Rhizophagus clarus]|uniref:Sal-like protein 3 n=1 Tax=Rhizophagus clarus TaxID=94130 RepID=A0A8H3MFT6_9GLOM|nr:sal-like protein 3 [Rhizophagus clarus]
MPTMPESINQMPFICKWLYSHSEPKHFETQEELRNHIDKHDINSCNRSSLGYICPWESCNKRQSSIIKLEEHLCGHTRQRPFRCPICTGLRFCSLDVLNRHLIINHNDNFVDPDCDGDACDENEELNLGHKDEATSYTKGKDNNTAKLSYRDVLVKGRNKEIEDFMNKRQQHERAVQVVKGSVDENKEAEDFMERRRQNDRAVQEYLYKAMEAMSLLSPKYEENEEYDEEYDLENYDNLPDAPQEELTEDQQDRLMLKTFCRTYKGTEAGEYFSKAYEIVEKGI